MFVSVLYVSVIVDMSLIFGQRYIAERSFQKKSLIAESVISQRGLSYIRYVM